MKGIINVTEPVQVPELFEPCNIDRDSGALLRTRTVEDQVQMVETTSLPLGNTCEQFDPIPPRPHPRLHPTIQPCPTIGSSSVPFPMRINTRGIHPRIPPLTCNRDQGNGTLHHL
jgi:hypothetical protein